ncbi:MAG TPA: alginate export family protein [Cytophagaceae bacterium]|nr:alginate export family protein [Cytophagaceae bacterium]
MKKRILFKPLAAIFIITAFSSISEAQLTMTAQVRTRTEFRQGQGTLIENHQTPSLFTSQRTRLNIGYTTDHLRFFTAIQDVRVWGQDASTIANSDGNRLDLHEGWGEIIFNDTTYLKKIKNLSLKIGRQEIVYDDERLLGSLGWLQQARSHDAAILKFAHKSWIVDAGAAFNQQREQKNTGNLYTGVPLVQLGTDSVNTAAPAGTNFIGTMYKSMQFLYISKEIAFTKATFLFFKDDFQKPAIALPGSKVPVFQKGTNDRVTIGGNIFATIMRKHKIDATFFYQGNKDKSGNTMDAYMACLSTQFAIGRKFTTGPGVDYLSGNNSHQTTTVNHRFDPLYGTPHKFWGYMDYFYVADPYGYKGNNNKSPGLLNFYWKSKYKLRDNMIATLDLHEFYAGNTVADESNTAQNLNRRLGTEIDFVLTYNMTKSIGIEAGYGLMLATQSMDKLKRTGAQTFGTKAIGATADIPTFTDKKNIGNWAYLMITIRPDLLGQIAAKLIDLTKSVDGLRKDVDTINQPK